MNEEDSQVQDAEAMARLARGEDVALDELMQRHGPRLWRYLWRQLQNHDDAADLAQETFVRVYTHRTTYRPEKSRFTTWIFTIATNLVRDHYRRRGRRPTVPLTVEREGEDAMDRAEGWLRDPSPDPAEQTHSRQCLARLKELVGRLPEELRTPLLLAEYEGMAQAEIASILRCSAKAVETRIYRARRRLRQQLQECLTADWS